MFARITKYKMKDGTRDEAIAIMENIKSEIMGLDGIVQFINAGNEDGSGYIVSVIESEEQSNANQPHVQRIWANFADLLEEIPTPDGYDVLANWKN